MIEITDGIYTEDLNVGEAVCFKSPVTISGNVQAPRVIVEGSITVTGSLACGLLVNKSGAALDLTNVSAVQLILEESLESQKAVFAQKVKAANDPALGSLLAVLDRPWACSRAIHTELHRPGIKAKVDALGWTQPEQQVIDFYFGG
jgi:hypothetical protein